MKNILLSLIVIISISGCTSSPVKPNISNNGYVDPFANMPIWRKIGIGLGGMKPVIAVRQQAMQEYRLKQEIKLRETCNNMTKEEKNKNKIGDCSVAHFKCMSFGASYGSVEYISCRTKLLEVEAISKQKK